MLLETRKNNQPKQLNTANKSKISDISTGTPSHRIAHTANTNHDISFIAPAFELASERRKRLSQHMNPTLPSVKDANDILSLAKDTAPAPVINLTGERLDRYNHCLILMELAERLSTVYNKPNCLTVDSIMRVFDAHNWTCPITATRFHKYDYPLTFGFVFDLSAYAGRLTASNITPRYIKGLAAGEWHIKRTPDIMKTRSHPMPALAVLGGAA